MQSTNNNADAEQSTNQESLSTRFWDRVQQALRLPKKVFTGRGQNSRQSTQTSQENASPIPEQLDSTSGLRPIDLSDDDLMAKRFVEEMDMLREGRSMDEAAHSQFDVVMEEVDELIEAFHEEDAEAVAEEQADLIVTLKVLSAIMGINSDKAYRAKMKYNLQKHGDLDERGKIQDDADVPKPDFSEYTNKEKTW